MIRESDYCGHHFPEQPLLNWEMGGWHPRARVSMTGLLQQMLGGLGAHTPIAGRFPMELTGNSGPFVNMR